MKFLGVLLITVLLPSLAFAAACAAGTETAPPPTATDESTPTPSPSPEPSPTKTAEPTRETEEPTEEPEEPTEEPEEPTEEPEEPTEEPGLPLELESSAFENSGKIPNTYAGTNSPPLSWENAPAGTLSFVLIMDDPDAIPVAGYVWDHWIVYDIPADILSLPEGAGAPGGAALPAGARHGRNSWGENFYGGPDPPSGVHGYVFKLYALSIAGLNPAGTTKSAIETAMANHILEQAELLGMYP